MSNRMLAYVGLDRPYRFERAIIVFVAFALGVAVLLGDIHVDVPADSFSDADFVDNGHFSVRGARRFADALAPVVRDACRGAMLSSAPR